MGRECPELHPALQKEDNRCFNCGARAHMKTVCQRPGGDQAISAQAASFDLEDLESSGSSEAETPLEEE